MNQSPPHAEYIKGALVGLILLIVGGLTYERIVQLPYFLAVVTFATGWVMKGPTDTTPAQLVQQITQAVLAAVQSANAGAPLLVGVPTQAPTSPPAKPPAPPTVPPPPAVLAGVVAGSLVLGMLAACHSDTPAEQAGVADYELAQEQCIQRATTNTEATLCRDNIKQRFNRLDGGVQ